MSFIRRVLRQAECRHHPKAGAKPAVLGLRFLRALGRHRFRSTIAVVLVVLEIWLPNLPAFAGSLTNPTWTANSTTAGATGISYTYGMTAATTATVSRVTMGVPSGTDCSTHYLALNGVSGNYASTPDSTSTSIIGDIDIRVKAALADWTPGGVWQALVAKWTGGARGYYFLVAPGGALEFMNSSDGTSYNTFDSTSNPTVSDGQSLWVRVTLDVDNGAGGKTATFYTSSDGSTWTQLGSAVTQAGTTSIYDNTQPVEVGTGWGGTADMSTGKFYSAEVRQGINGSVMASFDAGLAGPAGSATSWTASTGETWTVNRSGTNLPADIACDLTINSATGVSSTANAYLRLIDSLTAYVITTPASVTASTAISIQLTGYMNPLATGSSTSAITTYNNASPPVSNDTGTTGALTFTAAATTSTNSDGVLTYGVASNTSPQFRSFNSNSNAFSSAASTVSGATGISFQTRTSPKGVEALSGYVTATGQLYLMCFDGTTWTNEWNVNVGGTGVTRPFDISYETSSGDAMVLYSTNTGTTNELAYRTKPGTAGCGSSNWSSATNLDPVRTSGTVQWVKMAWDRRSTSDLITAIWADSNSDLSAMQWSGSAWGNEPTAALETSLEVVTAAQDIDDFDLDYESTSGDVLVVWANSAGNNGTNGVRYATCTGGTSTCTWGAVQSPGGTADDATNLDLAANPTSDEMVFGSIGNAGSDLQVAYWSGSAWTQTNNLDTTAATPVANSKMIAVGWLVSGGTSRSVITYEDSGATNVGWVVGNGSTFTTQSDFAASPGFASPQYSYQIDANPLKQNELMFNVSDGNNDLFGKRLVMDSTPTFTWTNSDGAALETNLSANDPAPYSYAYWRYAPTSQQGFQWFANVDALQPSSSYASENAPYSVSSAPGDIRLRMSTKLTSGTLAATKQKYKLQFATSTNGTWTDVGAAGGGSTWRYKDNATPADGTAITTALLTGATIKQSYTESNPTALNNNAMTLNQIGEWDFSLNGANAANGNKYYFRMANSTNSGTIGGYQTYAEISYNYTWSQSAYQWYTNANAIAPGSALANLNTGYSLSALATQTRLRMQVDAGAAGINARSARFKLQYATSPSSTTWTDVAAAGATSGIAYYNNSIPADGAPIPSTLLTGSDTAESYNESAPSVVNPNAVSANQQGEWDFALDFTNATAGPTYYLRVVQGDGTPLESYSAYARVSTPATPTHIQSNYNDDYSGTGATTIAASFLSQTTAGNLLVASFTWDTSATDYAFTCSDTQGNTFTNLPYQDDSTNNQDLGICYATNTLGGADTITVTWPTTRGFRGVAVSEYSGVSTAAAPITDVYNSSIITSSVTTSNGTTTPTVTTTQNNDLIYVAYNDTSSSTSNTAGTGFTRRADSGPGAVTVEDLTQSTAGAVTGTETWSIAGHRINTYIVAFKSGAPTNSYTQSAYRWYANADSAQPGSALANENTAYTAANSTNPLRLRMQVQSTSALSASAQSFSLQYATSTSGPWQALPNAFAYYNNPTPADGTTLSSSLLTGTNAVESYAEGDPSAVNPNALTANQKGEWDFSIDPTNAAPGTTYYFRMAKPDGSALSNYTYYPTLTTNGVSSDGQIVYNVSGNTTPQTRAYTGSSDSFGSAGNSVAGATGINMRVRTSPVRKEMIAGYVNSSGTLQIMCYQAGTWTNDWSVSVGGSGTQRRFDIAYETNSGDVMVLYSTNASTTNELAYRTKPGTSGCGTANWSSATNLDPVRTSGTVVWVKMAWDRRGSSNLITAAWADNSSSLSAMQWSGTAWGNEPSAASETSLQVVTASQDVDDFDVEYESNSGDVMMVWGNSAGADGTNGVRYRTCEGGTSTCTWGAVTTPPTFADDATELDLAANPNSDEMVFASIGKGGNDLQAGYWTGSAWIDTANLDTSTATPGANTGFIAAGWLTSGSTTRSVIAYNDSGSTNVSYVVGNGANFAVQTAFTSTPAFGNPQKRYEIDVDPLRKDRLMLTLSDTNSDIFAKRLVMDANGVFTWRDSDGGSALETNASAVTPGPFSFAYWRSTNTTSTWDQSAYRWYANANSTTPGAALANENTSYTLNSLASPIRLRMQLTTGANPAAASSQDFSLQYGTSTSGPWTTVTGSGTWKYYNNATPADNATIASSVLTGTDSLETYEEADPTPTIPNAISSNSQGEWDFALDPASASNSTYYFRMAKNGPTALDSYSQYATLTVSAGNQAPNAPTNLAQTKTDTTPIPGTTRYNFDSNITPWGNAGDANITLAYDTSTKRTGTGALKETIANSAQHGSIFDGPSTRDWSAGGSTLSMWVYLPATNNGTGWFSRFSIEDGSNNWTDGPNVTLTSGSWTLVTYTPAAGVTGSIQNILIQIENANNDATGSNVFYVDDLQQGSGIWTPETSVRFTASVSDPDVADTDQLCIEAQPINTAFTNTEQSCGSLVSQGSTANNTLSSLTNATQYHWQARVKDATGAYSSWVAYGGNNDTTTASPDFGVDSSAPSTGSANDGSTQGVDVNYNDGSLSSLGGNWSGFSDGSSGIARYEYSIGTSAGGTQTLTWTPTSLTAITATGLTLQTGTRYYINVRAVDVAGNTSSVVSSDGQYVAPTLTFTLGSSTVSLGNLNAANSYTSTQSVSVTTSTNAYSGYVIRQYAPSPLTNGSNSIASYAGTYASPTTWSGTGFGYTSSDTAIQSSGNLFSGATKYASLASSGPGDIVADHTANVTGTPITGESFSLTYKVVSSATQAAGAYSTSIRLSATASY